MIPDLDMPLEEDTLIYRLQDGTTMSKWEANRILLEALQQARQHWLGCSPPSILPVSQQGRDPSDGSIQHCTCIQTLSPTTSRRVATFAGLLVLAVRRGSQLPLDGTLQQA